MKSREAALAEIIDIARRNDLSLDDISGALGSPHETEASSAVTSLTRRLLAYIGGIFVFAGVVIYIAMFWGEMNAAAHIIITLGSGFVALILAILLLDHDYFSKAATPLFLMGAWLQPMGMMVAFDELGSGGDAQHAALAVTTVMLAQLLFIFIRHQRSVLLFLALAFGALTFWNAFDLLTVIEELNLVVTGLSLLLVTYGIDRTAHRSITGFWYFVGGATFLWAAFDLLQDTQLHVLYLGLTAFMIYISTVARSRTLLFASTLAMMGYLGYFTGEYFVDSIGWPIALILMGLLLIGISSMALRINRKYIA